MNFFKLACKGKKRRGFYVSLLSYIYCYFITLAFGLPPIFSPIRMLVDIGLDKYSIALCALLVNLCLFFVSFLFCTLFVAQLFQFLGYFWLPILTIGRQNGYTRFAVFLCPKVANKRLFCFSATLLTSFPCFRYFMFAVSLAFFSPLGLNLCPLFVRRSPVAKSIFEINFFNLTP